MEQDDYLLQRAENGLEKPECPEALRYYRRLKKFGVMTFGGGLYNQPHIELLEFEVIESAINEFEYIQAVNRKAQSRFNRGG